MCRSLRASKLQALTVTAVPLAGHSGIEKWFVRQRALEVRMVFFIPYLDITFAASPIKQRLSLFIASGCVLDLCTAFWNSLRELSLVAADSVSWNIIGVMHLISVDCPLLEVRQAYPRIGAGGFALTRVYRNYQSLSLLLAPFPSTTSLP